METPSMAVTTTTRSSNGTRALRETPAVDPPRRRRARIPEVAIGLLLMVGFSLVAVLWHMNTTRREPALALAVDVQRGEEIGAGDLRVVYLASDDPIAHLPESAERDLVGRTAVANLEQGTLLTRSQLVARPVLEPDEGVVGLALDPGQFPAIGLVPGDHVNVVSATPLAEGAAPGGADGALAPNTSVYAIEELETEGRQFISLRMPEADANRVASAAELGPVRLVLVGQ